MLAYKKIYSNTNGHYTCIHIYIHLHCSFWLKNTYCATYIYITYLMAAVTASYTHLRPYRKHVIRLDTGNQQIEFWSDPQEFPVSNSGWHGGHNWRPMCRVFMLRDFSYTGRRADYVHCLQFLLHDFSARLGVWRYVGANVGSHTNRSGVHAEIIFSGMDQMAAQLRPRPPPTRPVPVAAPTAARTATPRPLPSVSECSDVETEAPSASSTTEAPSAASTIEAPSAASTTEAPSASSASVATAPSGASSDRSWQLC